MRLFHILFAIVLGCACNSFAAPDKDSAWAAEATNVVVSLNSSKINGAAEVLKLPRVLEALNIDFFEQCKVGPSKQEMKDSKELWYVVNIPIRIHAVGRNSSNEYAPARYVRELSVRVALLVRKPKSKLKDARELKESRDKGAREKDAYYILTKEFTIADIPMRRAIKNSAGKDVGEAEVQLGMFVSQASVYAMLGVFNETTAFSGNSIAGYAVEATFKGESCREIEGKNAKNMRPGETPSSFLFSSKLISEVGSRNWWSSSRNYFETPSAELSCISETPYAPFYAPYYPRVKPMYGKPDAPSSGHSSSSEDGDSSSDSSSSPSSSSNSSTRSTL